MPDPATDRYWLSQLLLGTGKGVEGLPGSAVGLTDLEVSCLSLQCGSSWNSLPGASTGGCGQGAGVLLPLYTPALDHFSPPHGAASALNSFLNTHPWPFFIFFLIKDLIWNIFTFVLSMFFILIYVALNYLKWHCLIF